MILQLTKIKNRFARNLKNKRLLCVEIQILIPSMPNLT